MKRFSAVMAVLCVLGAGLFVLKQGRGPVPVKTVTTTMTGTVQLHIPDDSAKRTLLDNVDKYVDAPEGVVNWHVLGATKEIPAKSKDYSYMKPEFTDALEKLDGKQITIKGFMFPLGENKDQTLFLFGPFPVSCPFHYHVTPSLTVEVHADRNPVGFSYDPIVLSGRLQLVRDDPDNGVFYRLMEARKVSD
jgi:hypothetical protein